MKELTDGQFGDGAIANSSQGVLDARQSSHIQRICGCLASGCARTYRAESRMGLSVGPNTRHRCEGLEETTSQDSGERIKAAQSDRSAIKAAQTLAFVYTTGSLPQAKMTATFCRSGEAVRRNDLEKRSGAEEKSRKRSPKHSTQRTKGLRRSDCPHTAMGSIRGISGRKPASGKRQDRSDREPAK